MRTDERVRICHLHRALSWVLNKTFCLFVKGHKDLPFALNWFSDDVITTPLSLMGQAGKPLALEMYVA